MAMTSFSFGTEPNATLMSSYAHYYEVLRGGPHVMSFLLESLPSSRTISFLLEEVKLSH